MRKLGSIELETNRLLLRRFVVEDAKAMFENWASDADNLTYVTWDPHPNPKVTRGFVILMSAEHLKTQIQVGNLQKR